MSLTKHTNAPITMLRHGFKVKLPEWEGYWFIADDKIMAHCKNGEVCEATWLQSILRKDWLVFIEDED